MAIDYDSTGTLANRDSLYVFPQDSADTVLHDSLMVVDTSPEYESFLTLDAGNALLNSSEPLPLEKEHSDWIFLAFMGALIILGIVRFSFPRRFGQVLASLFSERSMINMLREGDLFTERIMLGMMSVYVAMMGLLLLVHGDHVGLFPELLRFSPLTWLLMTAAVLLWWLLRSLLVWTLGFFFKTFDATALYLNRMLTMNLGLGLVVLVLLPIAWYGEQQWMIQGILWVILAFNVYRVLRSIGDAFRLTKYGISYLLLYTLSVEVLPIVLLAGYIRHNLI